MVSRCPSRTPAGTFRLGYSVDNAKAPMRRCYEQCFGPEMAGRMANCQCSIRVSLPFVRTLLHGGFGAMLLRAACREVSTSGLSNRHFASRSGRGRVPVALQAAEANFVCAHALPSFDPASRQLTLPKKKHVPLGIVHLTTSKQYKLLPIPNFSGPHWAAGVDATTRALIAASARRAHVA